MPMHRNCDGYTRRDALRVGVLGAAGLSLAGYLRMASAGETKTAKGRSAIFINLVGGPSHMDTFDLKPNAPSEVRGEFDPIQTGVPGIEISEHLPKLAACAETYTILRGVTHTLAAHPLGQSYVATGSRPLPSLEYPGYGAVVARELPCAETLPPFVAIPSTNLKPGFLGVKYAALSTGVVPRPGQPFRVRGISLPDGVNSEKMEQRSELLSDLDTAFHGYEENNQLLEGLDEFSEQAHAMIASRNAREAFDVSRESPTFAAPFGITAFGQSCLLASRLIEAGVRFVTVTYAGWDTHLDNWNRLKSRLLPSLDEGLAALFRGLQLKGLLEETVVYVTGEFGRTPKINTQRVGRDHYPRNMFMLMSGGAIRGGRVLGASDEKAAAPAGDGYSPADVAASFYHALGIDHTREYQTNTGRPITIVRDGKIIQELFA